VIGSFSIIADQSISRAVEATFLDTRPPPVAELLLHHDKVALQPGALAGRAFDKLDQVFPLLRQGSTLLGDFHLLKPAQAAKAHV
jgi:hypothetical protein